MVQSMEIPRERMKRKMDESCPLSHDEVYQDPWVAKKIFAMEETRAKKMKTKRTRYQLWENGQGGEQKYVVPPAKDASPGTPPV
nr:uncharacterized protein I203_02107 [Kwoniella mangroviensis CBS 8507]OCF68721.1 hypothetical protein I203_02107 [Kwoniella mangroviensis CBS 8507]